MLGKGLTDTLEKAFFAGKEDGVFKLTFWITAQEEYNYNHKQMTW